MKRNTYKLNKTQNLFGFLEKQWRKHYKTFNDYSIGHFLRLGYFFILGLLYVWNSHFYEKTLNKCNQLQPQVNALRVKYTELQSSYTLNSTQSKVAKRVAHLGLYESKTPPYKIKININ